MKTKFHKTKGKITVDMDLLANEIVISNGTGEITMSLVQATDAVSLMDEGLQSLAVIILGHNILPKGKKKGKRK